MLNLVMFVLQASDVVSKLYAAHQERKPYFGVDIEVTIINCVTYQKYSNFRVGYQFISKFFRDGVETGAEGLFIIIFIF